MSHGNEQNLARQEKPRLRINGVVRVADRLRREMAQPISASRRQQLERFHAQSLLQIEQIFREHGGGPESLPAPSRRAYEFLRTLNFDSIVASANSGPAAEPPSIMSVFLSGLTRFCDNVVHRLAIAADAAGADETYYSIRSASVNIERHLKDNGLNGSSLTAPSRAIRGWLAFFSERENFELYLAALRNARATFDAHLSASSKFKPPTHIAFRPMSGLYRIRGDRDGTRIALPTAMISFSPGSFEALAQLVFHRRATREAVDQAARSDAFQTIQAELEALSGIVENAAGMHHDLGSSFERVNQAYFGGALARPQLCWSRVFTGRKFGPYDAIRDTVMLSSTLDRAHVPAFVVDFVVYHELLHKKLGVVWRNGRREAHTDEFRTQERRFARFEEAEALIQELARQDAQSFAIGS